jgi:hypothetical protein
VITSRTENLSNVFIQFVACNMCKVLLQELVLNKNILAWLCLILLWVLCLGPLRTWAKRCEHEIVRAHKKVSKGHPKTPPKSCSVVAYPQKCSVKPYVTRPSTKGNFNCLHAGPYTWQNRINQWLWAFGVPRPPNFCVRPTLQEVVFENNPSDHETWSIWCHMGIHVDNYIHLASHTPLVPHAQREANLVRLHLFHQCECLKCNGHGLSVPCVKWP